MSIWREGRPGTLKVPTINGETMRVDYAAISPEQGQRMIEVSRVCRESRRAVTDDCLCLCCQYAREHYYRQRREEITAARKAEGVPEGDWWGEDYGGG